MRFAVIDGSNKVRQINEVYGAIDTLGQINYSLPHDWQAIECGEDVTFEHYYSAGQFKLITASADKITITANGVDAATITAQVPEVLSEITFYHSDTGAGIAAVPVDPATHTATLQVTAITPGTIRIRAGEPTGTKLNEVVITAQ